MTEHPPRWAERLLTLALDPRHRESVTGDLLEEYREVILPARGPRRADRWYVRQVAGFWWRLIGVLGLLAGATHAWRTLIDEFVPTSDYYLRSAVLTWAMVAISVAAGLRAAY